MQTENMLVAKYILSRIRGCHRTFCSRAQRLTNSSINVKRNELFSQERARQMALVSKIEKIQVDHKGPPEDCTLLMNKHLSTPFNCAMHIKELLMSRSVLALVNGQPWDLHRPLMEDCELQFLHFKDEDPHICNEAFWRTGSFILGYILERCFKDEHFVELCSFPRPSVESGSFVYDCAIDIPDWTPSQAEFNCLSRIGAKLGHQDWRFDRLDVDASVALKIFEDNRFKSAQIPAIAELSSTGSHVTLYRMGDHVDITRGPLIASTTLLNRFSLTNLHDIETKELGTLKRVQGIATPKQLPIHYWPYEWLCARATKLNPGPQPTIRDIEKLAKVL